MVKGETRVVETTTVPVVGAGTRISWGAVIAGLFVAVVAQVMLTLLGAAIGLGILAAGAEAGTTTVGIAVGIWLLVTGFLSYWIAGWVAGRMSGNPSPRDGMWHGLVMFCVATVFMLFTLGTAAGAAIGGAASLLDTAIQSPVVAETMRNNLGQFTDPAAAPGQPVVTPQHTEQAAAAGSQAAFWALFVLGLSAAGAALGGLKGVPPAGSRTAYAA